MKPKKATLIICLLWSCATGFGQTGNLPAPQTNRGEIIRAEDRRRQLQLPTLRDAERRTTPGTRRANDEEQPLTKEELKKIKALLAPHEADLERYKDFLEQPKTGLFRLFSNTGCESKNLLRVGGECENFVPGGSSYSFRTEKHGEADWFDLRFDGANLIADAFLAQEIIAALGDVPLESVSLASAGMKFLADFKPEVRNREVRKQFAQLAGVVRSGDFYYSKKIKAVENTTYAMRIVAYSRQAKVAFRARREENPQTMKFLAVNSDKRVDVIIAFRIVRKDANASISILWKELQKRNAPEVVFEKDEKLSDFKDN